MTKEANMTRRPITRTDEAEVRRRVEQCGGASDRLRLIDQRGGIVLAVDRPGERWFIPADQGEAARLATVGIFPGPDGWEIEDVPAVAARRKLPAPWRWWGRGIFEFLARTDNEDYSAADAYPDEAVVYTSDLPGAETARRFEATSWSDARERAEDECWSRGLFGVSDAPPVDPLGWQINKEVSMGKRRPITRADEGEVRRRVEPLGYPVKVDQWGTIHIDGFVTKKLAGVGIHGGADGWEIEDVPAVAVRRKLPAPWAWWSCDAPRFAHLSQTGKLADCVAQAWPNEAIIYHKGERKGIDSRFDAASLEAARERAEDECWRRGLFGVSDAPEGDESDSDDAGPPSSRPLPLSDPSADPAARALRALIARVACCDASGWLVQPQESGAQKGAALARLCDSVVAEIRAGRREDQRVGSAVLVDYLTEHHRDTWHANETAAAFAVRLLRSADDTIETLRREAEGADAARAVVATERDTFREEARRLREQVGALDRECSAGAFNIDRVTKERDAAREERDRFERLHAAAEVTAGEIEVELGKVKTKLARAAEDMAAMRGAIDRTEQFLSGKVTT